jgi:hypothetical protein
MKVSDILKGNFSAVEIPYIEIPGSAPLIYDAPEDLLKQIDEKDIFGDYDLAEEFLMFTAEILDDEVREQDGPHHTLRWRAKVRNIDKVTPSEIADKTEEAYTEPEATYRTDENGHTIPEESNEESPEVREVPEPRDSPEV